MQSLQFKDEDQIEFIKNDKNIGYYIIKRVIDIIVSIAGIVILSPVFLITAAAIKLNSKGPVFFTQDRVGKDGSIFKICKFRSMFTDAESKSGPVWADKDDDRVTKVGKFIRKTRIDELPQLMNIIKGDMSIVGPRPERPYFTDLFAKEIPGFEDRLLVKPGLTGLAQINGGYDISPYEKLKYDREYINKRSIPFELLLMIKTVKVVISGDGAR